MRSPKVTAIRQRLRGLPRHWLELDRSLQLLGSLRDEGWHRSARGLPVDGEENPLPWLSYPFIAWLTRVIRETDRVIEYGGGHSTLWFSQRARSVTTIEHDERWAIWLRRQLPTAHVLLRLARVAEDGIDATSPYVNAAEELAGMKADIVCIDGVQRPACAIAALASLKSTGILIFDDSERPIYRQALTRLREEGLWRIDFRGMCPGTGTWSTTSVLGRDPGRWLHPETTPSE